jgi:hypothetical protein
MTENIETPLNIEIINVGKVTDRFVPFGENQYFPVKAGGKISFICESSEKALYYKEQANKNLIVNVVEPMESDIEVGKYDRVTDDLIPGAPYICKTLYKTIDAQGIGKQYYDVYGALNYSTDNLGLGQPDGNRFIIKLRNPLITSKSQIPNNPKSVIYLSDGDTPVKTFGKDAFQEDGSLIIIVNIKKPTSLLTLIVMWDKDDDEKHGQIDYEFNFKAVTFGKEGEVYPDLQDIQVKLPQNIILENKGSELVSVVPFKQNFQIEIPANDKLDITSNVAEESMYYLAQEQENLVVELK